jgi:SAM-dependent methyltransferase
VYIADYYEHYWSQSGFHPQRRSNPALAGLIASNIKAGSKLLDVGCGNGSAYAQNLLRRHDYVGVDVSENAIAEARASGIDTRRIDDASCLPFASGTFDAALCLEVFEHLFQPQLAAVEILRVLNLGGVLITTVPNAVYWRRRMEALFGHWNPLGDDLSVGEPWRDPHVRFFNRWSLHSMLSCAGFRDVAVGGHSTEYAGYAEDAHGLRKMYFAAHSSRCYQLLETWCPSLLAIRLHAIGFKRN